MLAKQWVQAAKTSLMAIRRRGFFNKQPIDQLQIGLLRQEAKLAIGHAFLLETAACSAGRFLELCQYFVRSVTVLVAHPQRTEFSLPGVPPDGRHTDL